LLWLPVYGIIVPNAFCQKLLAKKICLGKLPGLVVNVHTHNLSHGPWMWVQISASPEKTRWKDGPLDGRKSNKKIKAAKWGKHH